MNGATESILVTIKKMLGLGEDYTPFDTDIIVHINSAFMTLTQLGIGPEEGFQITDANNTWGDFISDNEMIGAVTNYTYLTVRTLFDPPSNSFVMDAMQKQIEQLGWRLNVQAESKKTFDFITDDEKARRRGWPGNDVIDGTVSEDSNP